MARSSFLSLLFHFSLAAAQLSSSSLEAHVDTLTLTNSFNPVKAAYWTGYPHHRRTPFAVSPDGTSAYLAYLDSSETGVIVQPVDPTTFAATGTPITVTGAKEAAGLVAHNDGFALLTNEAMPSGTSNAPAGSTPVPVVYRFTGGVQTWKTFIGGPDMDSLASPDVNGDLVFSEASGYYAAYVVVTAYAGAASGHFGDAIRYLTTDGTVETIPGASSSWGCSHNTGIAFEAADAPPFASICAEDQGAIWLNTKGQGMTTAGVKISNEHVINGGSGEPMGGMSGSYSSLARFVGESSYIFSWVSRGAASISTNEWMGSGYTKAVEATSNRNVAIATFSDKNTLVGEEATSDTSSADPDSQINWITSGTADCSNAHVAAFSGSQALVTWEEIAVPTCDFDAMGCRGTFTGTYYQLVGSDGAKVGAPIQSMDTFVAGDMVAMSDGRICWPYVAMNWSLDGAITRSSTVTKMSFACISASGAGSGTGAGSTSTSSSAASSAAAASSSPIAETSPATVETATSAPATSPAADPTVAVTEGDSQSTSVPATSNLAPTSTTVSTQQPIGSISSRTRTRTRPAGTRTRRATSCPPRRTTTVFVEG